MAKKKNRFDIRVKVQLITKDSDHEDFIVVDEEGNEENKDKDEGKTEPWKKMVAKFLEQALGVLLETDRRRGLPSDPPAEN